MIIAYQPPNWGQTSRASFSRRGLLRAAIALLTSSIPKVSPPKPLNLDWPPNLLPLGSKVSLWFLSDEDQMLAWEEFVVLGYQISYHSNYCLEYVLSFTGSYTHPCGLPKHFGDNFWNVKVEKFQPYNRSLVTNWAESGVTSEDDGVWTY